MKDTVYKAPEASLETDLEGQEQEFYVVSQLKFYVLYGATLGMYSVYWFYKHWQLYKTKNNESIWPIPRAIFSILFTHSLFKLVDEKHEREQTNHKWTAATLATAYVVMEISAGILSQLSGKEIGSPYTDIVALLLVLPIGLVLASAQKAINIAEGDALGDSNSTFTLANFIWIALGLAFWTLNIAGLLLVFGYLPE